MRRLLLNPEQETRWRVWLSCICIVLLLFSATVQLAHVHADGHVHSDCALCHVAQTTAHVATPQVLPHIVRPVAILAASVIPGFPRRFLFFHLWNRPPPDRAAFC